MYVQSKIYKFQNVSTKKNLTKLIGMSNENRMEDQIT